MEDAVDWSDSPIESSPLLAANHHGLQMAFEEPEPRFQGDYTFAIVDQEHINIPTGESFPPYMNGDGRLKPANSRVSKMGINLNRRKPTWEDYTNFVLYQGSQKVYEATFLENFVAHALHPNQLEACLSTGHNTGQNVHQYLRSVSDNVNKLATRMIQNTHSRIISFLANDDRETITFWDFEQFNERSFADFLPGNTFPVVDLMSRSWHRAFSHPSMVRYSATQYQFGADASPFEELDDVTGQSSLFRVRSAPYVAHEQNVRPPRTKKPKTCHLPGALPRKGTGVPRNNWLQGFGDYGLTGSPAVPGDHGNFQESPLSGLSARGDSGAPATQTSWSGAIDNVDELCTTAGGNMHVGDDTETNSVCSFHSQTKTPNRLEGLVAAYGPDVLLQESGLSPLPEITQSDAAGTVDPLWRMALIEDHKQRLAEKRPRTQQQRETPLKFDDYIERAIEQGDLRRLAPGLRRIADFVDPPTLDSELIQAPASLHNARLEDPPEGLGSDNDDPQAELVLHQERKKTKSTNKSTRSKRPNNDTSASGSNKRRKSPQYAKSNLPKTAQAAFERNPSTTFSSSSHPAHADACHGTSKTLENHQRLPPDAYFEKVSEQDQYAWRCSIKHPMGYYYNAGDRKNCPGCFTALSENPKRKVMDFYLPSRSHFFQPAPGIIWKPGRPQGKPRRSKHLSHNSIAKDAYWDAINTGATTDEALKKGIIAVEAYLRGKEEKRAKKVLTPEPTPEPVDLGPHSSDSKTMEHGQELPLGAYWKKQFRCDELAWRCDINHALGRYYLAGDVRSCPGCGSCRSGPGKHPEMDFYLPAGSIARQEAPDLVKWKPRPPYRLAKKSKKARQVVSHNQFCSKKYWELIDEGREHVEGGANEEALALAVKATDAHIDAKLAATQVELEKSESSKEQGSKPKGNPKPKSEPKNLPESEGNSSVRHGRSGARLFSFASPSPLVPRKSGSEELNDSELGEVTEYETGEDDESAQEIISISSEDESTSDSDSE
ncbi:uncharacterized protein N0V89_008347 [Didymosphaeria variabile]|uniref:Uncharacterized protein n=1 Tax=Didymosphaeria variabile TaxID=1932322 RepID=A0A9W9C8G8_9PLEO|nr:uncharacterized protein N0V89_008347 [Didymosphaeria variabile]KAJ4349729.1 hypothetical protein N0V89_008347 [Didymosphaeria variabile]